LVVPERIGNRVIGVKHDRRRSPGTPAIQTGETRVLGELPVAMASPVDPITRLPVSASNFSWRRAAALLAG